MKSTVHFPISPLAKILVKVGENVSEDTVLMEDSGLTPQETIINISQLLKIKPETIHRYLRKKIGEEVLMGEALVVVRSFFSSKIVKSPISGRIKEIDLTKGTLSLVDRGEFRERKKIKSHIRGRVKNITRTFLELEVDGEVFGILGGRGDDVVGKLVFAPKESLGILDVLDEDMEEAIVASQKLSPDVIVKLEVIGVKGFITGLAAIKSDLPWVEVGSETFKKLREFAGKKVWLRPATKQIIVMN